MNENQNVKLNSNEEQYNNTFGDQSYPPNSYDYNRGYTDSFYDEYEDSSAGSFLVGALVGGIIGAAVALFLAPKTGKEMREDFSAQAVQLKDKSIEISTVAKEKATEMTSVAKEKAADLTTVAKEKATEFGAVAKEKTGEVTKTIQEQSGQLVDKVKSMTSKNTASSDETTSSVDSEEEPEYIDVVTGNAETIDEADEVETPVSEALKEAVVKES